MSGKITARLVQIQEPNVCNALGATTLGHTLTTKNMGSRYNIVIAADENNIVPIFLYSHWNGALRKEILRRALKKGKNRWGDSISLAAIIFNEMVGGSEVDGNFGISTLPLEANWPLLVVDELRQKVTERKQVDLPIAASKLSPKNNYYGELICSWTFKEFISQG